MASTDARPVPRKNVAFRLYLAFRKNDGTLITSWTGADTELSLDGAAYSDATNEATEIGTSGTGYIDLTSSEMNADSLLVKSTVTNTDALPFVVALYPEEDGDYRGNATQLAGQTVSASGTVTFPNATIASTTNITAGTITTVTNLTNAPTSGDFTATMKASIATELATYDAPTNAEMVARTLLAASYATSAAQTTAQNDLDIITGSDGVTLATTQANYAPAKAGNQMDLVNAPNATAITAIQSGLATASALGVVDSVVDAILVDTAEIGVAGAGLTAIPWNASWDTEVQSEVADALTAFSWSTTQVILTSAYDAAKTAATQTSVNTIDGVVDAIKLTTDKIDTALVLDGLVYQFTANALELAPTGGSAPSAADIYTYFTDSNREDAFKADVSGLSTFNAASDTVTVGTNNDKTGYSLTQAFPANFAALGINASGHLSRVTLVDTTTTNTDMRGTDGANTTTPPTVVQIRQEIDANSTKTGYKLASDGLDQIAATSPNGVASTFATKLMQLWARFFNRSTRDSDEIKTYRDDGVTVATTQTYTASGSDEDVGEAT